jgi:hypothetical protein
MFPSVDRDDEREVVAHGEAVAVEVDESGFGGVVDDVREEAEELGEDSVHFSTPQKEQAMMSSFVVGAPQWRQEW